MDRALNFIIGEILRSDAPGPYDIDVTASTLRFLCGAMVLLVRFFGVLVVASVVLEVMF